jgi:hypothetical protein
MLSFIALVLATGASFQIYMAIADAAVPGSCGGP